MGGDTWSKDVLLESAGRVVAADFLVETLSCSEMGSQQAPTYFDLEVREKMYHSFMAADLVWLRGMRQRDPAVGHDT